MCTKPDSVVSPFRPPCGYFAPIFLYWCRNLHAEHNFLWKYFFFFNERLPWTTAAHRRSIFRCSTIRMLNVQPFITSTFHLFLKDITECNFPEIFLTRTYKYLEAVGRHWQLVPSHNQWEILHFYGQYPTYWYYWHLQNWTLIEITGTINKSYEHKDKPKNPISN